MAEISIILHIVRKLNSIIVLLFIQNISTEFILNKPIPLHRFSSNFSLFLGKISGYKHMFFLQMLLKSILAFFPFSKSFSQYV